MVTLDIRITAENNDSSAHFYPLNCSTSELNAIIIELEEIVQFLKVKKISEANFFRMKSRQIYYRRKERTIIIEGKTNKKTTAIWTLPNDPTTLVNFLIEKSFFTQEKAAKIKEKISRLDYKPEKVPKQAKMVSTRFIGTTRYKDDVLPKNEPLGADLSNKKDYFDELFDSSLAAIKKDV